MCYYLSSFDSLTLLFPFIQAKRQMHVAQKNEVWIPFKFSLTFSVLFFFRFGKHKKDDGREDRMERKGSSKSRAGDVQAVEEETQHMRLEHERWGASAIGTPLTGTFANHPISQMVKQGRSSLWKHSDVNLWNVLFYNYTLQRSLIDCSCRCHAEALTS